jgi:ferredoxin
MSGARVDVEVCAGHAICTILAPDLFQLDEEADVARADVAALTAAPLSRLREVAAACPAGAISVEST